MQRLTPEADALIESIDVAADAAALGISCDEVRRAMRDGIRAGLLTVEAAGEARIILRGTFPDEQGAAS